MFLCGTSEFIFLNFFYLYRQEDMDLSACVDLSAKSKAFMFEDFVILNSKLSSRQKLPKVLLWN